jgi:hypothetical protein
MGRVVKGSPIYLGSLHKLSADPIPQGELCVFFPGFCHQEHTIFRGRISMIFC